MLLHHRVGLRYDYGRFRVLVERELELHVCSRKEKALLQELRILAFEYVGSHLVECEDSKRVAFVDNCLNHRKMSFGPATLCLVLHHCDADLPRTVPQPFRDYVYRFVAHFKTDFSKCREQYSINTANASFEKNLLMSTTYQQPLLITLNVFLALLLRPVPRHLQD